MHCHSVSPIHEKTSRTTEGIDRLQREASTLAHVTHPDIIEALGFERRGDVGVLKLAHVDAAPLPSCTPLAPLAAGTLALTVAAALAHVHGQGFQHGALGPEHVLVRSDGRPVLCGFGASGPSDADGTAADVRGVAEVLTAALGPAEAALRARAAGEQDDAAALRRRLEALATEIAHGEPMSAAEVATALGTLVRGTSSRSRRPRRAQRHRRPRAVQRQPTPGRGPVHRRPRLAPQFGRRAGIIGVMVVTVTTGAAIASHAASGTRPADPAPPTSNTSGVEAPSTAPGGPANGPITIDGTTVRVGRSRFTAGAPGDILVVGRFTCREPQLAVLRPSTGAVYLFDTWPTGQDPVPPRQVATVSRATALAATPTDDGCDALGATGPDGSTAVATEPR